ncbi:hypothetical protein L3X38_031920 [Prunus dulcis]|uniref:Uncharacterized protein n=1 Tax=Prunus dulcis TaxID=3755 RepID=A0AAD4VDG0_PRUDU|nr:hypothetical protein L3X38_031920 [Prunus dulcis]
MGGLGIRNLEYVKNGALSGKILWCIGCTACEWHVRKEKGRFGGEEDAPSPLHSGFPNRTQHRELEDSVRPDFMSEFVYGY